ncbi:transposase family protein [Thermomonospora catenispora]|uniref:transposase family protein n=1 Tax=Thermomonospora catenispora TaxID=2493090 RepID=UPI0013756A20
MPDGTSISIDRPAADRPLYSGKHRCHEVSLHVTAMPASASAWVSGALPGSAHDLQAAPDPRHPASPVSVLADTAVPARGPVLITDKGRAGPQCSRRPPGFSPAAAAWPSGPSPG